MNKKAALVYLHLEKSPTYLQKLIKQGKIHPVMANHPTLPNIHRLEFTKEDLDSYLATKGEGRVGHRDDGRNKYTIYATAEELQKILATLKGLPTPCQPIRSNPPKTE